MNRPINRRKLLEALAALPMSSALFCHRQVFSQTPQTSATKPQPVLHLYCHGLHAYVFYKDHILLLTPPVMFHRYLAGTWEQEVEMKKGETYSLVGVSRQERRPAINSNNLYLTGINKIYTNLSYCQVKLPYPRQFISLRYVNANFEGESVTSNASQISKVPLLQVLEYEISDSANLRLDPFTGWQPTIDDSVVQQLHIFAEPEVIVPEDHALRAFDALIKMFAGVKLGLKSIPDPPLCPPASDPNDALGIVLEQEKSLAERYGCLGKLSARLQPNVRRGGKPKGAQPANCFSVIGNAS